MALGCTKHTAYIYDRGGMSRVSVLDTPVMVSWTRVRDDISDASVHLQHPSPECARVLENLRGGRHELVLFRGAERVWEGPITRLAYHGSTVEVHARDVGHYLYRTVMRAKYNNGGVNAASALVRVQGIMTAELARKEALDPPINVLPHAVFHHFPDDARTARITEVRQSTVWEDLDSLAHRGGIDYVAVGRSLIFWDTHRSIGQTPQVTEADFIGDVIVTEYAMDLATETTVTDGQGAFGKAGGVDSYYGWVEMLHTAYDESEGADPPTVPEMTSQAQRNLLGRNPAPIEVRVPDGSRINPQGVFTMANLVPGVRVPLRATLSGRPVAQMQKLDRVMVLDSRRGEEIRVTMSPASPLDEDV